jgi:hypothetical protein
MKQCKEHDQSGRIQTSAQPQNQSPQRSNAMIVDHSIRPEPSISYLAERLISGESPVRVNLSAPRYDDRGINRSELQNQPEQRRMERSNEKHGPANDAPMTAFRLREIMFNSPKIATAQN